MAAYLSRYNGWLPSNHAVYHAFVNHLSEKSTARLAAGAGHAASVQQFGSAIEANPVMLNLFNQILLQASQPKNLQINSLEDFLHVLDVVVSGSPKFHTAEGIVPQPIGVPMYIVFDILSNTSAAYDLFRMTEFNTALKALLNSWGAFLTTPASSATLNDGPDGWFSDAGISMLEEFRGTFNQTYVVPDDTAVNRGYTSWDAFFTREIKASARPLEMLPDYPPDRIIFNACESTVERWKFGVKLHDRFWLKSMPYSLYDMFNDQAIAQKFVGGTVYQAFLSPQDYHRWHSPIAGTIKSAVVVPGTYYAALPDEGDHEANDDPRGALIRSQPWLTVASTRAVITIQGDSPHIGLVGFIGVGMAEVSTCDITVKVGDYVDAGQQLGMFHFGGSSHAVIFNPEANVRFLTEEGVVKKGQHIHVNRAIGVSVAK